MLYVVKMRMKKKEDIWLKRIFLKGLNTENTKGRHTEGGKG